MTMDAETLELIRDGFRANGDEMLGYRRVTERVTDTPCQKGCLAPGSSAHFHTRTIYWEMIGSKSILTVRPDGMSVRQSSVHAPDTFVQNELVDGAHML